MKPSNYIKYFELKKTMQNIYIVWALCSEQD